MTDSSRLTNQLMAGAALAVIIVGVFYIIYRGIKNIPDSGRSMDGPFYSPWFKWK